MTRRLVEEIRSNFSGDPADYTVIFAIGDKRYHMDLTEEENRVWLEKITPYVDAADTGEPLTEKKVRSTRIRQWANENGIPCSQRGIIPARVIEQYQKSQEG